MQPGHALRRRSRIGRFLGVLALFSVAALVAARLDPLPPRFTGAGHASDGDSLRVGTDRVRLTGLDAPELDQICWRPEDSEWPCGRVARDEMARLLRVGGVDCQPEGEDRFGRTLARCTVAGKDIGAAIVAAGLAVSTGAYGQEEAAARTARRGIWDGRFTQPRNWRDEGPLDDPGTSLFEHVWNWFRELTGARALR
jgi:endonuclease YncB( thermonuclease family)